MVVEVALLIMISVAAFEIFYAFIKPLIYEKTANINEYNEVYLAQLFVDCKEIATCEDYSSQRCIEDICNLGNCVLEEDSCITNNLQTKFRQQSSRKS